MSARYGIQNFNVIVPTDAKLSLIDRAIDAGIRRMEVASFVNPRRVPQMADAEEVTARLRPQEEASYIGLVLNERGYERARLSGVNEVNYVIVASEAFSQRNQGMSVAASVENFSRIADANRGHLKLGLTIGAAFGCPFEGEVAFTNVLAIIETCMEFAPDEVVLADTIGVASPRDIEQRAGYVVKSFPGIDVRLHLHNTRNTGIANAWAGMDVGITKFDACFGGVGGCPFAPRATGNIATEDLVYMAERAGFRTNVDLQLAINTARWLEQQLDQTLPGMVMKAGGFPDMTGSAN